MLVDLVSSDGHRFQAYRAGPATATRGLIVLQEIFGVNAHMRHVTDAFGALGYAAICPAIFDRGERGIELTYAPEDAQRGLAIRAGIPVEQTLLDIEATAKALETTHKGVIGYCWGGTLAWLSAARLSQFQAAVAWYGSGIPAARDEVPKCPTQLHFAENDSTLPLSAVEDLRGARPEVEIFVYPGVGHGFGCEDRPVYDRTSAELAQKRSLAFFDQHLG